MIEKKKLLKSLSQCVFILVTAKPSVLLQFRILPLHVIRRKKLRLKDIASVVFLLLKTSRTDPIIYVFLKKERSMCCITRQCTLLV